MVIDCCFIYEPGEELALLYFDQEKRSTLAGLRAKLLSAFGAKHLSSGTTAANRCASLKCAGFMSAPCPYGLGTRSSTVSIRCESVRPLDLGHYAAADSHARP